MPFSASLEFGIGIITSATQNKSLNWKEFVPGIIMPFTKLQSSSTGQCPTSVVVIACCKVFGRSSLARVR